MITNLLRGNGKFDSQKAPSLVADQRGAILVIAVFMSSFLVGGLWYIIGIGDAAVYREYMQDGSDAIAFGAAVYHARGMNILVLINMIMAAVLAVLVVFKIAQVLLWIATAITCAFGAVFNPVCDLLLAANPPMDRIVSAVEKAVDGILRGLKISSDVVAYGMPWIAEVKAVSVAKQYEPTVRSGFMVSISMVPGGVLGDSGRKGLPVQDDDFKNLCERAGQYAGSFIFFPFSFIPGGEAVGKAAGKFIGKVTKMAPGFFCGASGGGGGAPTTEDIYGKDFDAEEHCKDRAKDAKKEAKKKGIPDTFDRKKCEEDIADTGKKLGGTKAGSSSGDSAKTSKRVYDGARNGDDFFAVYSFTTGDLKKQSDAAKGVDIAGWGKAKAGDPGALSKYHFARAEFYWEPGGKAAGGKKDWDSIKQEAMWNPRWRARLRRFRLPAKVASVMEGIGKGVGVLKSISGVLGGPSLPAEYEMGTTEILH